IMAEAAAAYALVRCQLDPTVQWVLAVAAAAGSALLFSALAWTPVEVRLACFALLLVVARTVTAEPWERRARVAQAGLVSVGLAAALLLAFGAVLSRLSTLPTVDDFSRAVDALRVAAAGPVAADGPWRIVPVPLLLLAALRPWRALRRYSDAGWLLALACLALPFGNEGGGWAVATPFLALLAGAGWDATRPLAWRRAATALVVLYVILSLVSEPAPTPETLPAPALAAARGMAPA
ncbi:MAG: hypothetical protein ABI629_26185, partial [bacterium]